LQNCNYYPPPLISTPCKTILLTQIHLYSWVKEIWVKLETLA
jgi:hypothetical protein